MPTGMPPPQLTPPEVVKVDIDDAGRIWWNGEVVPDRATLEDKLTSAAHQDVQPEMHLRPDKNAKYEVVAAVMASSQRLGLTKIGIVGSEQFIEIAGSSPARQRSHNPWTTQHSNETRPSTRSVSAS